MTDKTLDERLAPLAKAVDEIGKIDFATAKATPEATKALIAGAAVLLTAIAESIVRMAHAAEVSAEATRALTAAKIRLGK